MLGQERLFGPATLRCSALYVAEDQALSNRNRSNWDVRTNLPGKLAWNRVPSSRDARRLWLMGKGLRANLFIWWCWLLLPLLAGCWLLEPVPPDTCKNHNTWMRNPDGYFTDPGARKLAQAAACGEVAEVTRLMKVEHVDPDRFFSMEGNGIPLVAWPILTRSPEGLKALLENGADPNVALPYQTLNRGVRNNPNAMVIASEQEDQTFLKLLLDYRGDPNTRNANNESLLFNAYIHGNLFENVKLLVERGADVNANASASRSILEAYSGLRPFDQVYWLLEHGADPSLDYDIGKPIRRPDSQTIQDIYWRTTMPSWLKDQRRCQQWLEDHGYRRPAPSKRQVETWRSCGFPPEATSIAGVLPAQYPADWPPEGTMCK
jgi:hypothetical protein